MSYKTGSIDGNDTYKMGSVDGNGTCKMGSVDGNDTCKMGSVDGNDTCKMGSVDGNAKQLDGKNSIYTLFNACHIKGMLEILVGVSGLKLLSG